MYFDNLMKDWLTGKWGEMADSDVPDEPGTPRG
jgi:hypothetical protein